MSRYTLLFALELRHAYFADGWCDGVRIRPTPSCERLMRQYRLLFKATGQGAELYCDADAQQPGAPGSLLGFAEPGAFTFVIERASVDLANCTAIDAQPAAAPGASLYGFDNLTGGSASFDGIDYPLLHPAGKPFALGAVPWVQRRFRYTASSPVSSVAVLDAESRAPVWGPQAVVPAAPQVSLALAHLPEGRYLLAAPGVADWPFYLSDVALDGAFAIAAIHPRGAADGSARGAPCIDASGRVTPQRYTIALEARALTWRYFVIPHAGRAPEDWRIETVTARASASNGAAPLAFARAGEPARLGDRMAAVFSSPQPLTVAERPADAMTVRLTGGGLAQPLALPFPDVTRTVSRWPVPASAGAPATLGERDVADVFVYL